MSSPEPAVGGAVSPHHEALQKREDEAILPPVEVPHRLTIGAKEGFQRADGPQNGNGRRVDEGERGDGQGAGPIAAAQGVGEAAGGGGEGGLVGGDADDDGGGTNKSADPQIAKDQAPRGVSKAPLVAIDGLLVMLITSFIKDNQLYFAVGLIAIMLIMHVYLNSDRRKTKKTKRASMPVPRWFRRMWVPFLAMVVVSGIGFLRPDWVASWLPGAPFSVVERAAAKNQVKSYLAGVSEFLTWEPGVNPSAEQLDTIKEKFDLLTEERALGNLLGTKALTAEEIADLDFDQAWQKLLAGKSKNGFFRTLRQGYGEAEKLSVVGMVVEPVHEQSDEYKEGVRYAVFATLAYEGRYVLEDERIKNLSTVDLIMAISIPDRAEHKLIADFLKRSFADVTDGMVEEIGNNLIARPAGELRNDDRWEKAYFRVKPDGRILPEAMVKAREEIMVRYPMSLDETKGSGVKGWTPNLWRMGSSAQRVVTRTALP